MAACATIGVSESAALGTAVAAMGGLERSFVPKSYIAGGLLSTGEAAAAWHTNFGPRRLNPRQHDGTATQDHIPPMGYISARSRTIASFRVCPAREERHLPCGEC